MPHSAIPSVPAQHLERVAALLAQGEGRKLLGLAGPPGAGKSTLALRLQRAFADVAQVVPMDGFHLANDELRRLGRSQRKGAPDTFDADGYVALLRRLRHQRDDEIVYAPAFHREIEEAVAGAIPILPQTRLIITEGNYLLLEEGPWAQVVPLLDEAWYVEVNAPLRNRRLAQRHEEFGRSREEALAWMAQTDEPNARLIDASRPRATHLFHWDEGAAA